MTSLDLLIMGMAVCTVGLLLAAFVAVKVARGHSINALSDDERDDLEDGDVRYDK